MNANLSAAPAVLAAQARTLPIEGMTCASCVARVERSLRSLGLARAQQAQQATRERLTRLMGLWGAQTAFRLPERLPDLPAQTRERPDIERIAIEQRLDVQGAGLAAERGPTGPRATGADREFRLLFAGAQTVHGGVAILTTPESGRLSNPALN